MHADGLRAGAMLVADVLGRAAPDRAQQFASYYDYYDSNIAK